MSAGSELKILSDNITAGGGTVLFDPRNIFIEDAADVDQSSFVLGHEFSSTVSLSSSLGAGDNFGAAVAIDGKRVAIGTPGDDARFGNLQDAGAVYLFTFDVADLSGGRLEAIVGRGYVGGKNFQPLNLGAGDRFGTALALDGNRLVVGAPGDDGFGNQTSNAGAVYLPNFASDAFANLATRRLFGTGYDSGVSINVESDVGDGFGRAVALDGIDLAIGAPGDDGARDGRSNTGRVDVFEMAFNGAEPKSQIGAGYQDNVTFILGSKGRPSSTRLNFSGIDTILRNGDAFGAAVALDGNRLAIGAAGDDGNRNFCAESGAVYLYSFQQGNFFNLKRSNHTIGSNYESVQSFKGGARTTTGVSVDGVRFGDRFGSSIALDGDKLVVGAFGSDGRVRFQSLLTDERGPGGISQGRDSGSVFLMTLAKDNPLGRATLSGRLGLGWEGRFNPPSLQESSLIVRVGAGDAFGRSVALDGDTLIVGAPGADGFGPATSGSGEVFRFTFAGDDYRGVELSVLTHAMSAW